MSKAWVREHHPLVPLTDDRKVHVDKKTILYPLIDDRGLCLSDKLCVVIYTLIRLLKRTRSGKPNSKVSHLECCLCHKITLNQGTLSNTKTVKDCIVNSGVFDDYSCKMIEI